jgi:hypothetical protein
MPWLRRIIYMSQALRVHDTAGPKLSEPVREQRETESWVGIPTLRHREYSPIGPAIQVSVSCGHFFVLLVLDRSVPCDRDVSL